MLPDEKKMTPQANESPPAHSLPWADVVAQLETNVEDGLSPTSATQRLSQYGRNELSSSSGVGAGRILLAQIANAMQLVLVLAMAVSFGIGSYIEGGVTAAVVLLNVVIGFVQDYQAAKTMNSLRSLASPTASVIRDGARVCVTTAEVVPGDLVELKAGDVVPADVRLVEAVNFEADEALLTGESLPVRKDAECTFPASTGPGDRLNVAYSSSTVTKGRATGVVYATGMTTEIGAIAAALRKSDKFVRSPKAKVDGTVQLHQYAKAGVMTALVAIGSFLGVNKGTPLQRKLSWLACYLFLTACVFAVIVLAANYFEHRQEVIIYAVATGLSMIPASLLVVLTITMAAGTKRMATRHVIVRDLRSLEALGGVTDICSDKTGTLTEGRMVAKKAWISGYGTLTIEDFKDPFDPTQGSITHSDAEPRFQAEGDGGSTISTPGQTVDQNDSLRGYLEVAKLANLAHVHKAEDGSWKARGDPTEIAIRVLAKRFDTDPTASGTAATEIPDWELVCEFPFDSTVKKMSAIWRHLETGDEFIFTKGAVERVVDACLWKSTADETASNPMTTEDRQHILDNMNSLASLGLRVLAFASKQCDQPIKGDNLDRESLECDLVFHGLIGLYDPPRPESAPSVAICHQAGIDVRMLTGDHPGTATAIARQVGILPNRQDMGRVAADVADAMVMTAAQFDALNDDEIDALPVLPLVIARCTPTTKVRMIEALERRGRFCAMTGDGVNDSPSLKRAGVGIAMGMNGSDVAKDAADLVLTDDNFASILVAVEEGRRIFDNIQRFVLHLLAQNVAQALILLIGLIFKDSQRISVFPIAPVEILWIIMVTSSLPDMGLGFERGAPDILQRPPHNMAYGVFTWEICVDIVAYGCWIALLCLCSFSLRLYVFAEGTIGEGCNESLGGGCEDVFRARATCFTTLTWFSLFLAWELVDLRRSFFRMQPDSTRYLTQWAHDVWRNKFLFVSVIAGFIISFPLLYIPGLNDIVFKHTGIDWEWGIVFIAAWLFFTGIEAWKWGKRVYFRRRERAVDSESSAAESQFFEMRR